MKKLKKYFKGFTLVELIIVITILAILATLAFVWFQDFTKNARDWNRVASIKAIEKWLELYQIKVWTYPLPDSPINIKANSSIIWYQWIVWENVSNVLKINQTPNDPKDNEEYIYSVNNSKNKYQLLSYMEWDEYITFLPQVFAQDYSKRHLKVFWHNLWIILNTDNSKVDETEINVSTWTTNYKIVFEDNDTITSSWNTIFSNIYNRRDDLINNKDIAKFDNSLVGYWDMETLTDDWKLKDLSQYENHWTCYNWTSSWVCNTPWFWPQIVDWNWTTWKAMSFDGGGMIG